MTRERDTARIVREWMEAGATALPERVLDAVLDEVPATRQRRRPLAMSVDGRHVALAVGLAAAAVVVAAAVGFGYLIAPRAANPAPGQELPDPTGRPMPAEGRLEPATYAIDEPVPLTFDAPAGLRSCEVGFAPAVCGMSIAELTFGTISNVVVDPCSLPVTLRDPPVGRSVSDLVTALRALPGFDVRDVRDIVVDGHTGVELVITAPERRCRMGSWATPTRINGVSPGESNRLRIVDVNGTRLVMALAYHPTTPPADVAALQAAMESVRFNTP